MSLVFCKNTDRSVEDDTTRHSNMYPYRFTSFFTNPIKIPPNSQVGYISSQFSLNKNGGIEEEPFYMLIGHPALNAPVPIKPIKEYVRDWGDTTSFLAELANNYNPDGDYVHLQSMDDYYKNVLQKQFIRISEDVNEVKTAVNILYNEDDKVDIIVNPRPHDVNQFNQGFNCLGRNTEEIKYDGETTPEQPGLNYNDIDLEFRNEAEWCRVNSPAGEKKGKWSESTKFFQPVLNDAPDMNNPTANTEANYYNTQYTLDTLSNEDHLWGTKSALDASLFLKYNTKAWSITSSSTGIKKFIGDDTPSKNGGGHEGIGGGEVKSGGYALYGFANQAKTAADTHFDAAYVGNNTDVGFCGIAQQYVGVQSIPYIQSFSETFSHPESRSFKDSLEAFSSQVDMNCSEDEQLPENAVSRYVFGLRIIEENDDQGNGSLVAQAEVLDSQNGTLGQSKYITVGPKLDIKALSNGINTALENPFQFDNVNQYAINTYNDSGPRLKANLLFRFRWSSPYTMAIDYTMPVLSEPLSYNLKTDEPYEAPKPPSPTTSIVNNVVSQFEMSNATCPISQTDGSSFRDSPMLELQNIDGNGNAAERVELSVNNQAISNAQIFRIFIDAGVGRTVKLKFNDFNFKHSSKAFERMAFQVSNDGINYQYVKGASFLVGTDPADPFSSPGINVNFDDDADGLILPKDFATADADPDFNGNNGEYQTSFRYLKLLYSYENLFGESNETTFDIHVSMNEEFDQGVTDKNSDPTKGWILLYDMLDDYTTQDAFYIPSYFGDMGLVSYHVADNHSHYTKGYYDVRRSYRYLERIKRGVEGADRYTSLAEYQDFFKDHLRDETLLQRNDNGFTTPKLVGVTPELFEGDNSMPIKDIQFLVNTIRNEDATLVIRDVNMEKRFHLGEPQNLDIGLVLGLTKPNSSESIILLEDDRGIGEYIFEGEYTINVNDNQFTNHIQIANLPIQSQNGVVSSQTKTIYVFSALDVSDKIDVNDDRIYAHSAPEVLWIDLNNYSELNVNELKIHITNDNNTSQKLLVGNTSIVLMFRTKPPHAAGYLPNQIKVNPMNNLVGAQI